MDQVALAAMDQVVLVAWGAERVYEFEGYVSLKVLGERCHCVKSVSASIESIAICFG